MPDAPCHFVVERSSEGPCEACSQERDGWNHHKLGSHEWRGLVLKRCGHEEASHQQGYAGRPKEEWNCRKCWGGPERCPTCGYGIIMIDEVSEPNHAYESPPDTPERAQEHAR